MFKQPGSSGTVTSPTVQSFCCLKDIYKTYNVAVLCLTDYLLYAPALQWHILYVQSACVINLRVVLYWLTLNSNNTQFESSGVFGVCLNMRNLKRTTPSNSNSSILLVPRNAGRFLNWCFINFLVWQCKAWTFSRMLLSSGSGTQQFPNTPRHPHISNMFNRVFFQRIQQISVRTRFSLAEQITLLQVIPTMALDSSENRLLYCFNVTKEVSILHRYRHMRHSIWHTLWHSIWHMFKHSISHPMAYVVAFYLADSGASCLAHLFWHFSDILFGVLSDS